MDFLDAHTHIQFSNYDEDRGAVISRAREAGVSMVLVGTQVSTSRAGITLAQKYPDMMWAAVGYHPAHCNAEWHHDPNEQISPEPEIFDAAEFEALARDPKVVAIGECGLDYYRLPEDHEKAAADKSAQKKVFLEQIEIARKVKKPLMIHCRSAFSELIDILKENKTALAELPHPGIIHFFTGTFEEASELASLGFVFTFGGVITFARNYDDVIRAIPLEKILSETDAPYLAPAPYRGKRNEPAYVLETVKKLAEIKGVSEDVMAATIRENAQRTLGI
jgi:TatD DNase family protein